MRLFGDPAAWPRHDLVAFSTEFDTELMLAAYREGLFPMPLDAAHPGEMGWWSPVRRGVLFPESFRLSRSLRRSRHRFAVGFDQAFDQVLAGCADPGRPHGWINPVMSSAFLELHRQGWAHSAESWDESGRLVGGVIGISFGGLFSAESMFHDPVFGRDAGKVALASMIDLFLAAPGRPRLVDVQWRTAHLASLGVTEIPRHRYLQLLPELLAQPEPAWPGAS